MALKGVCKLSFSKRDVLLQTYYYTHNRMETWRWEEIYIKEQVGNTLKSQDRITRCDYYLIFFYFVFST